MSQIGAKNKEKLPGSSNQAQDFRARLQTELIKRSRKNPKYSLRSYAKFLGVDSSRLSKILRNERPVNDELFERFAAKLGLKPHEKAQYRAAQQAKKYGLEFSLSPERHTYLQLSQDTFELIEDWRHYAILELMKVRGFKPEAKYVAKKLGMGVPEAQGYIERLQRIGLLSISARGEWTDLSKGFSTHILSEKETTAAHQRSQIEILKLAQAAVEEMPMDRRDQSSMMMATHSSKVEEAKARIKAFRRELCAFLEDCPEPDMVYQLSVSLFPLLNQEGEQS